LGDDAEFGDVVAVIDQPLYELIITSLRDCFGTGHDPNIPTVRDTNNGGLIGIVEIRDEVGGFERPNKLHTPFGIGLEVMDEAARVVGFKRSGEIACVEDVGGRNCAIGVQLVTFDTIKGVVLDEGGNMCDDIPVTHKAIQINPRSMARNGGLESDPKYFDHVSHPLNNVASAATNNDRPACILIELRLFVIVIVRMLDPGDKLARGDGVK